jgi:hypothetical protein
MKLGDFLTAINYSKESLLDGENNLNEKDYTPYVVNRCLSYFPDTVLQSNQMNVLPSIGKKMHFDYLRLSVRQRKRFSKWLKDEESEVIDMLKQVYNYSHKTAKEVLPLLSPEDIQLLKEQTFTGGQK